MWAFIYKPLLYCYISFALLSPGKPSGEAIAHASAGLSMTPSFSAAPFHPIHVSTTNIEYNKNDSKLEVICTIFTDDFEAALAKQFHTKIDLNRTDMHTAMDALVKKYIASCLQVKTGASPLSFTYIGFEINKEATDVYLESDKIAPVKKIDVDVSLLHNLFDDQINIVHIIVNGVRKSEKLEYPDKRVEQVF